MSKHKNTKQKHDSVYPGTGNASSLLPGGDAGQNLKPAANDFKKFLKSDLVRNTKASGKQVDMPLVDKAAQFLKSSDSMRSSKASGKSADIAELDKKAQRKLAKNLCIYGLPEVIDEDLLDYVVNLFQKRLHINIDSSKIVSCNRVSESLQDPNQPQSRIVVKMKDKKDKLNILNVRSRLKGCCVLIQEDLTQRRRDHCKELAKRVGWKNVWTAGGRIFWEEDGEVHSTDLD